MSKLHSLVRLSVVVGAILLAMPGERFARGITGGTIGDCDTSKLRTVSCYDDQGDLCGQQWKKCAGCIPGVTINKDFVCEESTDEVCKTTNPGCARKAHKLNDSCIQQVCPQP